MEKLRIFCPLCLQTLDWGTTNEDTVSTEFWDVVVPRFQANHKCLDKKPDTTIYSIETNKCDVKILLYCATPEQIEAYREFGYDKTKWETLFVRDRITDEEYVYEIVYNPLTTSPKQIALEMQEDHEAENIWKSNK